MGSSLDAFFGRVYANGARQDLAGGLDFAAGLAVTLVTLEDGPVLRVSPSVSASDIPNDSDVTGGTVADALDTLLAETCKKFVAAKTTNSATAPPDSVTLGTAGTPKFLRITISAQLGLDTTGAGKLYGYVTHALLSDGPTNTATGEAAAQPLIVFDMSVNTLQTANATAIIAYTSGVSDCKLSWKFNAAGIALADDYSFIAYYTIEDLGAVPT